MQTGSSASVSGSTVRLQSSEWPHLDIRHPTFVEVLRFLNALRKFRMTHPTLPIPSAVEIIDVDFMQMVALQADVDVLPASLSEAVDLIMRRRIWLRD